MKRTAFEALVTEAFRSIPAGFRKRLQNVAVMVEDEPDPGLLAEMEIEPPDTLFGLYHGTPVTQRGWDFGNQLPDRIVIYQRPIESVCDDEDDVFATIAETLIHEAGHYFGLSEEEIEEIEERYWRGEDIGDPLTGEHGRSGRGSPHR
jgi:predicted Zn-dependent protease with MMP-like domain